MAALVGQDSRNILETILFREVKKAMGWKVCFGRAQPLGRGKPSTDVANRTLRTEQSSYGSSQARLWHDDSIVVCSHKIICTYFSRLHRGHGLDDGLSDLLTNCRIAAGLWEPSDLQHTIPMISARRSPSRLGLSSKLCTWTKGISRLIKMYTIVVQVPYYYAQYRTVPYFYHRRGRAVGS